MPTYLVLGEFTQEFAEDIRNRTVASEEFVEGILEPLDVSLEAVYVVMGRYDFVAIVNAPSNEAVAQGVLATGEVGGIRTETLPAFSSETFDDLVSGLPQPM